MKIKLVLPWGGEFCFEKKPMSEERFGTICMTVAAIAVCALLYGLFTSTI